MQNLCNRTQNPKPHTNAQTLNRLTHQNARNKASQSRAVNSNINIIQCTCVYDNRSHGAGWNVPGNFANCERVRM